MFLLAILFLNSPDVNLIPSSFRVEAKGKDIRTIRAIILLYQSMGKQSMVTSGCLLVINVRILFTVRHLLIVFYF